MKKLIVMLIAMATVAAHAELMINVDLGNNAWVGSTTAAGVVSSTGWQQKAGTPSFTNQSLTYASGSAATGITMSGFGSGNFTSIGATTTDGDYTMYNRALGLFAQNQNGGSKIYLNGLSNIGSAYDVYVYIATGANSAGLNIVDTFSISDGTTTYYLKIDEDQASYQGTYIQATATTSGDAVLGNYVKFSNLSLDTLVITGMDVSRNDTASAAGFSGIQIVAVPEPATVGMLGLGSLVAVMVRRIRRRN